MKKWQKILIVCLCIITITIIPISASGNIENDDSFTNGVSVGTLYGNGIGLTQSVQSSNGWVQYNMPISSQVLVQTQENRFSYNSFDYRYYEGMWSDGTISSTYDDFVQSIKTKYNSNDTITLEFEFNELVANITNGGEFNNVFNMLARGDVRYIDIKNIDNFLSSVSSVSLGGVYSFTETHQLTVTYIRKNMVTPDQLPEGVDAREIINQTQKTYTASSKSALAQKIKDDRTNDEISYDIIGISNYSIYMQGNITKRVNNGIIIPLDGSVNITIPIFGTGYNTHDFIYQTGISFIGMSSAEKETIYVDKLGIDNFFTSVYNALDVNFIGEISFMDILVIIVGLSITVWILKVFAGG